MFKQILFYILSLILPHRDDPYIKEYMIDTEFVPAYVYWIDDINVLLSTYGYTQIFNTYNRKNNIIDTCDSCIYGYDRGFVYCKYEHRNIKSMKEFSTTIKQYDMDSNLIFSKDLFPTVIPLICKRENIILKTGDPVLEQNTYILDITKDTFEKYEKETESKEWYSRDLNKKVVIGEYDRLWFYEKGSRLKKQK